MEITVRGKRLIDCLTQGIADYVERNKIKTLVIGLSGGLDSTVCAALCYIAKQKLKPYYDLETVGISLPCSSNMDEENIIAGHCGAFTDKFFVQNLQHLYEQTKDTCEEKSPISTSISQGNIKARLRMLYLYNYASVSRGIVIDTDNLTECLLGFWTLHGDEGDLNPIGCLWKTEVYLLAQDLIEYLSKEVEVKDERQLDFMTLALESAIKITPTDGNGVMAGGDLAQIAPGHTYADVDDILQHVAILYWHNMTEATAKEMDVMSEKYGEETVRKVVNRMKASEFKRKHRPFIIDLYGNVRTKDYNMLSLVDRYNGPYDLSTKVQ